VDSSGDILYETKMFEYKRGFPESGAGNRIFEGVGSEDGIGIGS
jgi:hypothetical protein